MTTTILDAAYEYDEMLQEALELLDPAEVAPLLGPFLEQLAQAGRQVAERPLRIGLRQLLTRWGRQVANQTGDFPNVWLQPADGPKKREQRQDPNLPQAWKAKGAALRRKIQEHAAAGPGEQADDAGTTQIYAQIERLLDYGEIDRALVKLAGVDGCQEDARMLTRKLEAIQAQLRLGSSTRRQAKEKEAKLAAEIRSILEQAHHGPPPSEWVTLPLTTASPLPKP